MAWEHRVTAIWERDGLLGASCYCLLSFDNHQSSLDVRYTCEMATAAESAEPVLHRKLGQSSGEAAGHRCL